MKIFNLILIISISLLSCKKNNVIDIPNLNADSTFMDSRDGKVYTFQHMGTQVWMTINLNYAAVGSWCNECATYGRLYDWNTALTAAPPGWHLPSDADWTILTDYLGGESLAGGKMKSLSGWNNPNTGATNSSGFAGLPGGFSSPSGTFLEVGANGFWWSSTAFITNYAWLRDLHFNGVDIGRNAVNETEGFSIRCIRD